MVNNLSAFSFRPFVFLIALIASKWVEVFPDYYNYEMSIINAQWPSLVLFHLGYTSAKLNTSYMFVIRPTFWELALYERCALPKEQPNQKAWNYFLLSMKNLSYSVFSESLQVVIHL